MMRSFWVIPFLVSACLATCPSETLPLPASWPDGKFDYPNGTPQCFTQGSSMNISWETTYSSSNLYLVHGGDYGSPTSIASNTGTNWVDWTVDYDAKNHSIPFVFRVVNATGTAKDQADGGFLSGKFYINFNSAASTSTATTSTASATNTGSSATHEPTADSGNKGSSNSVALGVGLGVGLGVAACIGGALAFFFIRRRGNKASPASATQDYQFAAVPDKDDSSTAAPAGSPVYEAAGQSTQELSGDHNWSNSAGQEPDRPRYELA